MNAGSAAPWVALAALVGATIAQRVIELARSARHTRWIAARGGIESGRGHFPLLVLVHALWPILLVGEVGWGGARPGDAWPAWLAAWVLAQALRAWAMSALGERWNVRVWVLPGVPPVRHGPYRWLRHPNYAAVATELVAAPMMFGAWRTAVAISLLNAIALGLRIRVENRALRGASAAAAADLNDAGRPLAAESSRPPRRAAATGPSAGRRGPSARVGTP